MSLLVRVSALVKNSLVWLVWLSSRVLAVLGVGGGVLGVCGGVLGVGGGDSEGA